MSEEKLAANEGIKIRSNYLRGTIKEGLADVSTGSMSEDDQQLLNSTAPISRTIATSVPTVASTSWKRPFPS